MSALLQLRLSNGYDCATEFEAFNPASLQAGCEGVIRTLRVDAAREPGHFDRVADMNGYVRRLQAEISDENGTIKRIEWSERGHDAVAVDRLWNNYVHDRLCKIEESRRHASSEMPERLHVHVGPLDPVAPWLSPFNDNRAPIVRTGDLSIVRSEPFRQSREITWTELWDGVMHARWIDEQIASLSGWLGKIDRPRPRLVHTNKNPKVTA